MKKEPIYNEPVGDDEGFVAGDAYPFREDGSCANMTDQTSEEADTMAGDAGAGGETPDEDGEEAPHGAALAAAAEWKDKYVRLQAEFDNYRKRTLKEKMDLVQSGGRDVLLAMIGVRDDVQRALEAIEKSNDLDALREGVVLIAQKFTETLRQKGVVEIDVLDKEFDADLCEAVARFDAGAKRRGRVIDVVQRGYMLGERVLRFAKVVVGE